jgi:hypothetical protein
LPEPVRQIQHDAREITGFGKPQQEARNIELMHR